ncbi:MAG: MOFRL family protein, partial [Myxococcota bacterium]
HALPPAGRPPMALLLGGEVVVAGVGAGVRGGRMQELALAAAVALDGAEFLVVATSSDGVDGAGAAGAWIDGHTASRIRAAGIDPMGALDRHDAGAALAAVDALLPEAPTGTNVRDWVIALVGPTPFGGC